MAVIMVVLASWVIFKTLVPRGAKEWRNAGLLQAFVIALYTEMYGFPLTIYLISSIFGIDIPLLHLKGHLWATILGYGDRGAVVEMFLGYGFIIAGLFLLFRGWREIHRAPREGRLLTEGLYGFMRHPQYTGIFMIVVGQLIHWPTLLTLILFPLIVAAYVSLAIREERTLSRSFGPQYEEYRRKVPMFFPSWRRLKVLMEGV